VNFLQGGHQAALKYKPVTLPSPPICSARLSSFALMVVPSARSFSVGGIQGNDAPSGSASTASRPAVVMTLPESRSRITRAGMVSTCRPGKRQHRDRALEDADDLTETFI
jgi:hypothetical protein